MPRRKREAMPAWLKLYTDTREMAMAAPNEYLGEALKGLYRLLTEPEYGGEDLSLTAQLLFLQLRKGTDESIGDYQNAVARGKRASAVRWGHGEAIVPEEPYIFPIDEEMSPKLREAYTRLNELNRQMAAESELAAEEYDG